MAYGVDADVIGLVPILNSVTYPASSTRGTWLTQISAVIDARLEAKDYTTPLTSGTNDYVKMTYYCTIKVASMAIYAAAVSGEWTERADKWSAEFDKFLEDLANGDFTLTDQDSPIASKTGYIQFARFNRRGEY